MVNRRSLSSFERAGIGAEIRFGREAGANGRREHTVCNGFPRHRSRAVADAHSSPLRAASDAGNPLSRRRRLAIGRAVTPNFERTMPEARGVIARYRDYLPVTDATP